MGYSRTQRGPRIVTDGLVLNLDAANYKSYPGSGTNWNDLSISSNDGILINGPTFNNSYGGYFSLDGADDYINTTYNSNLTSTTPFTLNIWGIPAIFSFVIDSLGNFSGVYFDGSIFGIGDGSSSSFNFAIFLTVVTLNPFNNYTVLYDGSNDANGVTIYVNGISLPLIINNNTPLTDPFTYNIPWTIGAYFIDNPPLSPIVLSGGDIALFQIYNRVLNAQEVSQNYNALKSRFNIL